VVTKSVEKLFGSMCLLLYSLWFPSLFQNFLDSFLAVNFLMVKDFLFILLGQVRRVNLENYMSSRISGLSNYSNGHKNGDSKFPLLLALCNAMRSLHKYVSS
jgi:hypothetical protein